MEEFSMPQSILQVVSEKGFDGIRGKESDSRQNQFKVQ